MFLGFNSVPVEPISIEIVNPQHTHYSSFEWCVMLFSLTNAPTAFQCFMNDIFSNMLNVCILIHLNNMEQHREHAHEVLQCLQKITCMPTLINVTSTPTPWITLATCSLWLVSQWPITRSRPSKNGLNHTSEGHPVLLRIHEFLLEIHF